jgi:hypothetical protein
LATQITTVRLPLDLYKRAKKICEKLNKGMSALLTDGLLEKVEELEKRLYSSADMQRAVEERERERRRKALTLSEPAPLADSAPAVDKVKPPDEDASVLDPPDALYREHAEKIFAVYDDVTERRIVAQEAIRAICDERPLTSDPITVERRLHKMVTRLRAPDDVDRRIERAERQELRREVEERPRPAPGAMSFFKKMLGVDGDEQESDTNNEEENEENE